MRPIGPSPTQAEKRAERAHAPYRPNGIGANLRSHAESPAKAFLGWGHAMQPASLDLADHLKRWNDGDAAAFEELVPVVYEGLRQVAHGRRRRERSDLSLNTTALVHEAYLKLGDLRQTRIRDRAHFLAMASRVMRRLLVDHARARKAGKRGGD